MICITCKQKEALNDFYEECFDCLNDYHNKKAKCIHCGRALVANQYGILYCPMCQKGFDKQFNEMVRSTDGGYY